MFDCERKVDLPALTLSPTPPCRETTTGDPAPFPAYDAVVIGASVGGLAALRRLLSLLPIDFPVPLLIAQHVRRERTSRLPQLLAARTLLRVKEAEAAERLRPGVVYTAPSDRHLLVHPTRTLELTASPRVNFCRPAADPLFRSAAECFGSRVLSVVLTGAGTDGAGGTEAVKRAGGVTIAQDAVTADLFSMPRAAIETGAVDFVLPLDGIAAALITLVTVPGAATLFRTSLAGAQHYRAAQRRVCLPPKPIRSGPPAGISSAGEDRLRGSVVRAPHNRSALADPVPAGLPGNTPDT